MSDERIDALVSMVEALRNKTEDMVERIAELDRRITAFEAAQAMTRGTLSQEQE